MTPILENGKCDYTDPQDSVNKIEQSDRCNLLKSVQSQSKITHSIFLTMTHFSTHDKTQVR